MATKKKSDLEAMFEELGQPWPDEELQFRIQRVTRDKQYAQVAAYVDARTVARRLNEVLPRYGATWDYSWEVVDDTTAEERSSTGYTENVRYINVRGAITIHLTNGRTITRQDVGEGNDFKSAVSDALKRAFVLFGGDGAYRGADIWLRQGEFNEKGRIMIDHAELLRRFKGEKPNHQSSSAQSTGSQQQGGGQRKCKDPDAPASEKAQNYAHGLMKKAGVNDKEHRAILASIITGGEKVDIEAMTCQQASDIIEAMRDEETAKAFLQKLNEAIKDQEELLPEDEFPPEEDLPF